MKVVLLSILFFISFQAIAQCGIGYVDPTFQLAKTDETCNLNDGTVSVINFSGGVASFTFTIIAPSPSYVGQSNSTGYFTGLSAGEYYIQLLDNCGSVRVRHITILPYSLSFTYKIDSIGCRLYQINFVTNPLHTAAQYGIVVNGITTWQTVNTFSFSCDSGYVTLLVKDKCGNIKSTTEYIRPQFHPYIAAIDHLFYCDGWDAYVRGVGFRTPTTYCMYDWTNTLVSCNTTGIFYHIPYGRYKAIASDGCNSDTFNVHMDSAAGGVQLDVSNFSCNDFTMHVDGLGGQICLYSEASDSSLTLFRCQDSMVFNHVPYGSYCAFIFDPCTNQTIKICRGVYNEFTLHLNAVAEPTCTTDSTQVWLYFSNTHTGDYLDGTNNAPYNFEVYKPDNSLLYSGIAPQDVIVFNLPVITGQYKIIATDKCGIKDSFFLNPVVLKINKQVTITSKCPGALWTNGSGDALITASSALQVTPVIIKKNGIDTLINNNYNTGNNYTFFDLEPATYIVKYNVTGCTITAYDTFTVKPYSLPFILPSYIYQCDAGGLNFNVNVSNGLNPYTYEIIGSTPSIPSINMLQDSSLFIINNGIRYSQIRVRVIDGCGNSAIKNADIFPVGNISITASDTCFYHNMTLAADSLPTAIYTWYKQTRPGDSTIIANTSIYKSYITPDSTGLYICKMVIGNSCITRVTNYNLTGNCYGVLPLDSLPGKPIVNIDSTLRIFPNPSTNIIHVRFNNRKKTNYLIQIINVLGQKVYEDYLYGIDRKDYQITKSLARGQYFIKINEHTFIQIIQ